MREWKNRHPSGPEVVHVIGPIPMMCAAATLTREWGVCTFASLNPIMVDGTGMYGGCRIAVGGKVRFACIQILQPGMGDAAHFALSGMVFGANNFVGVSLVPDDHSDAQLRREYHGRIDLPALVATAPLQGLDRELALWDRESFAYGVWTAGSRVATAGKEPASFPRTMSEPHADDVPCPWILLAYIRSHFTLFSDLQIANATKKETVGRQSRYPCHSPNHGSPSCGSPGCLRGLAFRPAIRQ
jgi:hypothetical protein